MWQFDNATVQQRRWYATMHQNKHGAIEFDRWKYTHYFEFIWSRWTKEYWGWVKVGWRRKQDLGKNIVPWWNLGCTTVQDFSNPYNKLSWGIKWIKFLVCQDKYFVAIQDWAGAGKSHSLKPQPKNKSPTYSVRRGGPWNLCGRCTIRRCGRSRLRSCTDILGNSPCRRSPADNLNGGNASD